MFIKKKNNDGTEKSNVVEDKIDEIKLNIQADGVRRNIQSSPLKKIHNTSSNGLDVYKSVKNWAEQEKFAEKTKEYIELLTDGTAVVISSLINKGNK